MSEIKTFTEEELKAIRRHPYVKSATAKMIRFTAAFKEEFWRRYKEECQSPRSIVKALGFDPEILGKRRIAGILLHIREQAESGEGFRDVNKVREVKVKASVTDQELPPSKTILKMQHKIAYMEQELEFIKKTIMADREARQK